MASPHHAAIATASRSHAPPAHVAGKFTYGTAGFRMKADLLDAVVFRVGLLAALRSRAVGGKVIGVMITASHNPVEDNGVKLVDPMGEMLDQSWESFATELANAPSDEDVAKLYDQIAAKFKIDLSTPAKVVYGRDTRPSGESLCRALADALKAAGAEAVDHDLKTTPQLHYITRCLNDPSYGTPDEKGYYSKLAAAYKALVAGLPPLHVTVDCANGVGAPKLRELAAHLGDAVRLTPVRDDTTKGVLNHKCGADFVKVNVKKPEGLDLQPHALHASLDGDADRIVFYYADESGAFNLLDGDRISALLGGYIMETVRAAGLEASISVGVVQTAYANGNSTAYLRDGLNVPVAFTPTGVKHLHHRAQEYDVGVYFEANGHGTVVFSGAAEKAIRAAADIVEPSAEVGSARSGDAKPKGSGGVNGRDHRDMIESMVQALFPKFFEAAPKNQTLPVVMCAIVFEIAPQWVKPEMLLMMMQ